MDSSDLRYNSLSRFYCILFSCVYIKSLVYLPDFLQISTHQGYFSGNRQSHNDPIASTITIKDMGKYHRYQLVIILTDAKSFQLQLELQISDNLAICLTACSDCQQGNYESSVLLTFYEGNPPGWTDDSLHKMSWVWKAFPCQNVIKFLGPNPIK